MKTKFKYALSALSALILMLSVSGTATADNQKQNLVLSYSDGRPDSIGLKAVNASLSSVGVRVSNVTLPEAAKPLLKISQSRALNEEEVRTVMSHFSLHRGELLDQIKLAGREPAMHRGGFLSISEEGVAPYPKVYDMKALSSEIKVFLQDKFGRLHVNSADSGLGIDEVMTIVSGGSWTWFFVLPGDVVGKLILGHIGLDDKGWRISYPGLIPHGAYLDAEYGLIVAYAHGPQKFVMRYEDPSVMGTGLLNTNPWIDLSGETPKLLERSIGSE